MVKTEKDAALFLKYQKMIEDELELFILDFGEESELKKACEYILLSGGKRFRPILSLLIADALRKGYNVLPSALAVEFFHTASLIADDLPCMDDEKERRNKKTLHRVFGENVALLASYSLISAGYEQIAKNSEILSEKAFPSSYTSDQLCVFILKRIAKLGGICGATNGQYLDLFPTSHTFRNLCKIIHQKTVTLFEVSFIVGWLFGGGDIALLEKVIICSHRFGMAFQIADDIIDVKEDETKNKTMNIVTFLGYEKSKMFFEKQIQAFKRILIELNIMTPSFEEVCNLLEKTIENSSLNRII